ncbi:hypothetical protein CB1_001951019 [Camelus ferus]|nr:hypothetical protein CB1_001951019 [Camelus ferus]
MTKGVWSGETKTLRGAFSRFVCLQVLCHQHSPPRHGHLAFRGHRANIRKAADHCRCPLLHTGSFIHPISGKHMGRHLNKVSMNNALVLIQNCFNDEEATWEDWRRRTRQRAVHAHHTPIGTGPLRSSPVQTGTQTPAWRHGRRAGAKPGTREADCGNNHGSRSLTSAAVSSESIEVPNFLGEREWPLSPEKDFW